MRGADLIFIVGKENFDEEILSNTNATIIKIFLDDDTAYNVVKNFVEIFTLPGLPKIDFVKISETKNFVAFGEGITPLDALKNISDLNKLSNAKKILLNVTTPPSNFSCEDAQKTISFLERIAPNDEIAFGCSIDKFADKVKIIVLQNRIAEKEI